MYVEIPRLFFFFIFRTRRKILLANTSFPVFKYLESFPRNLYLYPPYYRIILS